MAFPDFKNWRFNPFTSVFNPIAIADELHLIQFDAEANAFGIRLFEGVRLVEPSTVAIVHNVTGGAVFTEVPRTTAPSTGQFRVDYLAPTFFGTSFIEFNSADDGKEMSVSYEGLGTNVKDRFQLLQATVIGSNLGVEGNLEITDNIKMDGVVNGPWDFGDQAVTNPKDPTNDDGIGDRIYNDRRYEFSLSDFGFEDTGKWILDSGVTFSPTGGTDSKRSLTFAGDSTLKEATFATNGVARFFPTLEGDTTNGYIRAKISGGFDGDIVPIIEFFDKSKVSLGVGGGRILNTYLSASYQIFSFALTESTFANSAFYTIVFRVEAAATVGQADIDFWRIGNNVGLSDEIIALILGDTGRGAYGGSDQIAFSGKGMVQMRPTVADNGYSLNDSISPSSTETFDFLIDGTELLGRQITHIEIQITSRNISSDIDYGYRLNTRGGVVNILSPFKVLQPDQTAGIPADGMLIIPVYGVDGTTRKSFIRLFGINNDPGFSRNFDVDFIVHRLYLA